MTTKSHRVSVAADHIQKLSGARPVPAISELVWNALDADATRVDIDIEYNELGMTSISVSDNGHGIRHDKIVERFGNLGGSWKANGSLSRAKKRFLHGKEGKGRFKALALGRVSDWKVRYELDGKVYEYTITLIRDDLADFRVSEPMAVDGRQKTGVTVVISELDREYRSLEGEEAVQSLSETFALYLTDYTDVEIYISGEKLNPNDLIVERVETKLADVSYNGTDYPFSLEVIEWKAASERWMFLCGEEGFPFSKFSPNFHSPGYNFSAYLKSALVTKLQEKGLLDVLLDAHPLVDVCTEAAQHIKEHFSQKDKEAARSEIDEWKREKIYPYKQEPSTPVEEVERKVFDIVALNVSHHLDSFSTQDAKSKALQFNMLKTAIERGPEELQHIFTEVLNLPVRKQKELSKLLAEAELANVITASKKVSDRLKFVSGLEALLFDKDSKSVLKERSQLHRIIADNNTWIFGEEFNLSVDDQSLTRVLEKHKELLKEDVVIDKPVRRVDGSVGIVDLMLSRSIPQNHADEREHLIVELKRPSVKLGMTELSQIESYAFAVAADERFKSLKTRWSFWIVSNDMDGNAEMKTRQKDKPQGLIYQNEDGSISVWAKTWSEILSECTSRLRFVQDHLQARVDKENSLKYLKKTYAKYLEGVAEEDNDNLEDVQKAGE